MFISILWNYNFCFFKKLRKAINQEDRNPVLISTPYLVYFLPIALLCTCVCLSVYVCVFAAQIFFLLMFLKGSTHMCACERKMIDSHYSSITVILCLDEVFYSSRAHQVSCAIWTMSLRVLPVFTSQALGLEECAITLSFLHGFQGSNLSFPTCKATILPSVLSSQPNSSL